MKSIISITPLAIERDSRTYKIAASFTRFGYRSIVVEGIPSNLDKTSLPFELISLGETDTKMDKNVIILNKKSPSKKAIKKIVYFIVGVIKRVTPAKFFQSCVFNIYVCQNIYSTYTITKKTLFKADLYYLHSPLQFIPVYRAAEQYKIPIIYDAHDFYCLWSPFINNLIERWCIWTARDLITVSDGVASLIQKKYGRKPQVIKNNHDLRLDKQLVPSIKEYMGLKKSDFLLVNVGQFRTEGQPMEPVLIAMKQLPNNVHLAFLGENTKKYNDLIKSFELETRVHTLESVNPDNIVPFINSADVSIILLTNENKNLLNCLPNKFFQSISAKLIILYPELPEIQKIAERYQLGLPIDATSSQSIYNAIASIISNSSLRKKFYDNLDYASLELNWQNEEVKLKEIIDAALNKKIK
jgi:glycosyltransferase involved in cell wall biosynthesis